MKKLLLKMLLMSVKFVCCPVAYAIGMLLYVRPRNHRLPVYCRKSRTLGVQNEF